MKKYTTTIPEKHQSYVKVGGNDVCLDFVTVIKNNVLKKIGTRVASPDNREIRIIEVRIIEVRLYKLMMVCSCFVVKRVYFVIRC